MTPGALSFSSKERAHWLETCKAHRHSCGIGQVSPCNKDYPLAHYILGNCNQDNSISPGLHGLHSLLLQCFLSVPLSLGFHTIYHHNSGSFEKIDCNSCLKDCKRSCYNRGNNIESFGRDPTCLLERWSFQRGKMCNDIFWQHPLGKRWQKHQQNEQTTLLVVVGIRSWILKTMK